MAGTASEKQDRRSKVTDDTLGIIREGWESGDPVDVIAKDAKLSAPTVRKYAEQEGWKRGERARPKTGAAASATTAPRFDEPTRLSGRVRCTECESMTSTDPCEYCGKKLRKGWGER